MKISLVILLIPLMLTAADFNGLYDRYLQPRIFLHERINYDFSLSDDIEWNRRMLTDSGLRMIWGSVTKNDLLRNEQLNINADLTERLKFGAVYRYYEGRIYPEDIEEHCLRLNYMLIKGLHSSASVSLYSDKEKIDVGYGLLWLSKNREEYISAKIVLEDQFFDKRNTDNLRQTKNPLKIKWESRLLKDNLTLYTCGSAGKGYTRRSAFGSGYPITEKNTNSACLSLDYGFNNMNTTVLHGRYYNFTDKSQDQQPENNYAYYQQIIEYGIRHRYFFLQTWSLTAGIRHILLRSELDSEHSFEIDRSEIMPELRLKYRQDMLEYGLSYFSSVQEIEACEHEENTIETYEDKAEVSCTVFFNENSRLVLSLSHVTTINGFGGGSVQYMINF